MDHGTWSQEAQSLTNKWFFDNNLRAVEALYRAHPERLSVPLEALGLGEAGASIDNAVMLRRRAGVEIHGTLLSDVLRSVSQVSDIPIHKLIEQNRSKKIYYWRCVCGYLMREMCNASLVAIGMGMHRHYTVTRRMLIHVTKKPKMFEQSILRVRKKLGGRDAPPLRGGANAPVGELNV